VISLDEQREAKISGGRSSEGHASQQQPDNDSHRRKTGTHVAVAVVLGRRLHELAGWTPSTAPEEHVRTRRAISTAGRPPVLLAQFSSIRLGGSSLSMTSSQHAAESHVGRY
jgi:hypothetical protein